MNKILTIVGARPQFIKAAAVSRVLRKTNGFKEVLVHTGQHYDDNMSAVFFRELEIPLPDYNLEVGSGLHGRQTGQMLEKIEQVVVREKPRIIMVYGDTNSTLAGALVAAKLHIPLAHVEAGLRSFNRMMPEEINRLLSDHVSSWLFCPTQTAVTNLAAEGIRENVHLVGDVMYDCSLYYAEKAAEIYDPLKRLKIKENEFVLVTIHRAENTDNEENLKSILSALARLDMPVILPLHPRTRKIMENSAIEITDPVRLIEPVSYLEMQLLEKYAHVIMTDSGGVQKEAYFFATPCITLRGETEWVETVESGWNRITGADTKRIITAYKNLSVPSAQEKLYGDGHASEKIVELLRIRN